MPSLHTGWALWSGFLIARYARRRIVRVLGVLYPLMTMFVVLATGNHYLLDVVAGGAAMALGALGARECRQATRALRRGSRTAGGCVTATGGAGRRRRSATG